MRAVSMLFVTIILVFAVCTYAVSQEKTPVKPVAPADVGKAPPDLVVKEIKCGTGNKLQFTVANIGRDSLPSGWMAVADVFFDGRRMGHVDLGGRPTSGDITPAGGSATYLVAFDITRPVTVQVVADATNSIREFSEANNTMTVKVKPCEDLKCCIGGNYDGASVDDPRCPVGPETGRFSMILNQETKCGSKIWFQTETTRFEGTVSPRPDRCCIIRGTAKGIPGTKDDGCVHSVEALLCRGTDGKWAAEKGTYRSIGTRRCCDGTFNMRQR